MTNHLAPLAAIACFIAYSLVATVSGGSLITLASPLLIAGIALFVWQGRRDDRAAA